MSKYRSRKVKYDGIIFDSQKEAARWCLLRALEKQGTISDLQRQVKYALAPAVYETYARYSPKTGKRLKDGKRCVEQAVNYVADFVYLDEHGQMVVEDVKGFRTKEYIVKRKWMLDKYGIKINEV